MNTRLEWQADRIEAVLAHHKVPARVTGGTVTPRWVRFQVIPALGARIASITGLAEELAAALDAPAVRVARQGAAIAVEVPRDDPHPVRLQPLLRGLHNVPPVTAVLGIADDGTPLLVRLPSPDVAHILVAGTTGSGKTALLRAMVLSLAAFNGAEILRFVLVDPKGSAFRGLEGLPHLARPVISEPGEAVEALGSLVRLMEVRGRQRNKGSLPACILIIDELADLLLVAGMEAEWPLTRLLSRGREAGVHVVAATQKPTAAVIGSLVKANFPVRLVGKVASPEDARVAAGWRGTGAERLLGRGDFIAVAEGRLLRFQAAYIAPEEIAAWCANRGWCPSNPMGTSTNILPGVQAGLPLAQSTADQEDRVATLARRLRPWWLEHGGEWGAKSRAVRYLFGDDAPAGGMFWELTMAAISYIEAEENSTSTTSEKPADGCFGNDSNSVEE